MREQKIHQVLKYKSGSNRYNLWKGLKQWQTKTFPTTKSRHNKIATNNARNWSTLIMGYWSLLHFFKPPSGRVIYCKMHFTGPQLPKKWGMSEDIKVIPLLPGDCPLLPAHATHVQHFTLYMCTPTMPLSSNGHYYYESCINQVFLIII